MFAGWGEGEEVGGYVGWWWGFGGCVVEDGGAFEGVGEEDAGVEDVRAGEGAERGGYGAEVVAGDAGRGGVAEGGDDVEGVFYEGGGAEGVGWDGLRVLRVVGASVAALVHGDDVVAGFLLGELGHDVAP